jgi:hypothetical protein
MLMRFAISFLVFWSHLSFAEESELKLIKSQPADGVYSLTVLDGVTQSGSARSTPIGAAIQLQRVGPNIITYWSGKTLLSTARDIFLHSADSRKAGVSRVLFENAVALSNRGTAIDPLSLSTPESYQFQDCPIDSKGHLKNGISWNYERSRDVVRRCDAEDFQVVPRIWTGPWRANCLAQPQNLGKVTSWVSCAPPGACSPDQAVTKRRMGRVRLDIMKRKCAGLKAPPVPPAEDPVCLMPMKTVKYIVVHQTEAVETVGPPDIQEEHKKRGFDDIGYHFVISKTSTGWRIFQGRPIGSEGTHGGSGLNAESIAIVVAGNYLPGYVSSQKRKKDIIMAPEAIHLLHSLIVRLKDQNPAIDTIMSHGEYKYAGSGCMTDCPSPTVQHIVNQLRERYF